MAAGELIVHGAREHNLKDVTVQAPAERARLRDRALGLRQVQPCLRHDLRGGAAPLRRVALRLRAAVPADDGEARRRLDRRALAGDLDRPEERPRATRARRSERSPRSTTTSASVRAVGRPHCPVCGRPIAGQRSTRSSSKVLALPEGTRFTVNAPVVRDRKGEFRDVLEELRRDGFTRVKVDGEQRLLEDEIILDKKFKHTIEVVVDRLVMKPDLRQRLTQSIETSTSLAEGLVAIDVIDGDYHLFSENFAYPEHGVSLPESSPYFSFNAPHGACPRCTGGASSRSIPTSSCPTPASRSRRARSCRGRSAARGSTSRSSRRSPTRRDPGHDPVARADERAAGQVPPRDRRRPDPRHLPQPDGPQAAVHDGVRGARRETSSGATARRTRPSSASGSRSTCRCAPAPCATAPGSSRKCLRSRWARGRSTSSRGCRSPPPCGSSTGSS